VKHLVLLPAYVMIPGNLQIPMVQDTRRQQCPSLSPFAALMPTSLTKAAGSIRRGSGKASCSVGVRIKELDVAHDPRPPCRCRSGAH
jgi:hypothetical protein